MNTSDPSVLFRRIQKRPFYRFEVIRVASEAVAPEYRGTFLVISRPPINSIADSTLVPFYFPVEGEAERLAAILNQCWMLAPNCLAQDVLNFVLGVPIEAA